MANIYINNFLILKMKVAFFEIKGWERPIIKNGLKGFSLKFFNEPLTEENVRQVKDIEVLSVFLNSNITKKFLANFRS